MPATASPQLPAYRLRKGHLLPAYGAGAAVLRTPVISVDGSMVTALVAVTGADGTNSAARLVRFPVDLCVEVEYPTAAPTGDFVRLVRVAKSSGAKIVVLDLLHPDSEVAVHGKEQFATLCTVHHTFKAHPGISTAEAQASHPEQWCQSCTVAAASVAHERVYGHRDEARSATA